MGRSVGWRPARVGRRGGWTPWLVASALFLLGLVPIAGCAIGDGDGDGRANRDQLLAYLDADARFAAYADLDQVREGLGFDAPTDQDDADRLLRSYAAYAAPIYHFGRPNDSPLALIIDGWQVRGAAASPAGVALDRRAVMVLRTDQPWDEIVDGLEAEGFTDRGDGILTTEAAVSEMVYTAIGSNDEVVIAGQDPDVVAERLGSDGPGPERLVELMELGDQPVVVVSHLDTGSSEGASCLDEFVAATGIPTTGGIWISHIGPGGDPDRVLVESGDRWQALSRPLTVGQPVIDGELLRIDLTIEGLDDEPAEGVYDSVLTRMSATDRVLEAEYDCP